MNSTPDPSLPDPDEHARKVDQILREHTDPLPDTENSVENDVPLADHDPANPVTRTGKAAPKTTTPDEQLAPEAEFEAGRDAAEDEAQAAGEEASEDDLNR